MLKENILRVYGLKSDPEKETRKIAKQLTFWSENGKVVFKDFKLVSVFQTYKLPFRISLRDLSEQGIASKHNKAGSVSIKIEGETVTAFESGSFSVISKEQKKEEFLLTVAKYLGQFSKKRRKGIDRFIDDLQSN